MHLKQVNCKEYPCSITAMQPLGCAQATLMGAILVGEHMQPLCKERLHNLIGTFKLVLAS